MKTILIVDDEFALVENLTEMLRDEGYRVVSAGNGKDGLARLQKEVPDLVITDFMMPIGTGRDLVRAMRRLPALHSVPVVMMSATSKTVALSDADGSIEVSAFLRKPFDWEKLLKTIIKLVGRAEKSEAP